VKTRRLSFRGPASSCRLRHGARRRVRSGLHDRLTFRRPFEYSLLRHEISSRTADDDTVRERIRTRRKLQRYTHSIGEQPDRTQIERHGLPAGRVPVHREGVDQFIAVVDLDCGYSAVHSTDDAGEWGGRYSPVTGDIRMES